MTAHILDFPNKSVPEGVSRDFKRGASYICRVAMGRNKAEMGDIIIDLVVKGEISPQEGAYYEGLFGVEP